MPDCVNGSTGVAVGCFVNVANGNVMEMIIGIVAIML